MTPFTSDELELLASCLAHVAAQYQRENEVLGRDWRDDPALLSLDTLATKLTDMRTDAMNVPPDPHEAAALNAEAAAEKVGH